ncbi:type 4a pilus biogenesis protein PilO [Patescibacteria group bacterium]
MPENKLNDKSNDQYKRYYRSLEPILEKPKNRAYTATVFSFLAVSLFGWYGIRPTLQTIISLRREIQDSIEVNTQMEHKIVNLLEAQSSYQQIRPQLPLLGEALPNDPDVIPFVFQIRNLANNVEASVSAISVPTVPLLGKEATQSMSQKDKEQPITVPVTFSVIGNYESIKSFIDGIVNMRRLALVRSMSVQQSHEKSSIFSSEQQLLLTVKADAFYAP